MCGSNPLNLRFCFRFTNQIKIPGKLRICANPGQATLQMTEDKRWHPNKLRKKLNNSEDMDYLPDTSSIDDPLMNEENLS